MGTKYQKNHRTFYVKEDLWESIKKSAEEQGRTPSNYLVNLHSEHIVRTVRLSSGIGDAGKSAAGLKPDPEKISGSQEAKDLSETKKNPVSEGS